MIDKAVTPVEIYKYIDKYVVGQEEAKIATANALFIHYIKWVQSLYSNKIYRNSNLLLAGPSGSGKTYIVRKGIEAIQELTGYDIMPMLEIDCTQITGTGWKGSDINDLIDQHLANLGGGKRVTRDDIIKAETTVIFFDEIDKVCGGGSDTHLTEFNKQSQYTLLKIVEGTNISLPSVKETLSTHRMLCVFAGNFPTVRTARDLDGKVMGFHETVPTGKLDSSALHVELQKAGLSTQLAGRIAVVAELKELTIPQLRHALKRSEGSIYKEYQELFKHIGYDLKLSRYRTNKIVERCYKNKTGVRGLQTALEESLQNEIFNIQPEWEDLLDLGGDEDVND